MTISQLRKNKLVILTFLLLVGGAIAISLAAVSMASRSQIPLPSQLHELDKAAYVGNAKAVQRILSLSGSSNLHTVANARDILGRTPLMAAAQGGHSAVMKELIAAGANVNAADKQGWTPLMAAAGGGYAHAARHTHVCTALAAVRRGVGPPARAARRACGSSSRAPGCASA